jgi:DNA helicase-2/ATP-dependent DNA helicase PcrA
VDREERFLFALEEPEAPSDEHSGKRCDPRSQVCRQTGKEPARHSERSEESPARRRRIEPEMPHSAQHGPSGIQFGATKDRASQEPFPDAPPGQAQPHEAQAADPERPAGSPVSAVAKAEAIRNLLADLTGPQREAVTHTDGPLLILAGPGTGKTRVVTRRAAHLALTVTQPRHLLAITFTNKAAREMRERIDALGLGGGMAVGTFHAFCAGLLRRYHQRAGISRDFTIFDRDDRRKLLADVLEAGGMENCGYTPASAEQEISWLKNAMISATDLVARGGDWRTRLLLPIYTTYEKRLAQMQALDFDDLLAKVAGLLEGDEELRKELEDRYRYVLVDEYQDTNACQYKIARLLTRDRGNLCATGDPDQSIYGWRGADIGNILSFEKDYPHAKVVRLEQNYRSTKRILAIADHLIAGNRQRKAKTLWTQNQPGASVRLIEADSAEDEAAAVAQDIRQKISGGISPGQIAVFYRVNSLSRVMEDAFLQAGVAYQVARGVEFYNRKEIKDVLAYLRVLVNPADEVSLVRIINTPTRGLGTTTVDRLVTTARQTGRRVHEVLTDSESLRALGKPAAKLMEFAALLRNLRLALAMPPQQALEFVMAHSGLRAVYAGDQSADDSPAANLDELVSAAAAFEAAHPHADLVAWLEHAALVSDVDSLDDQRPRVTLMTLHSAKGLEFDCVYLVGMEDGLLPFRREDSDGYARTELEEERRLCFVGMTRARKHLMLSRARYRMTRGATRRTALSGFLDELPEELLESASSSRPAAGRASRPDPGRLPVDIEQWSVGTLVRHPVHGIGQVQRIERGARRTHVDVLFRSGARQTWVLEFADLTRIEFDEVSE